MWPYPSGTVDLVTFTEEILNGKLDFFCSGLYFQNEQGCTWSNVEECI